MRDMNNNRSWSRIMGSRYHFYLVGMSSALIIAGFSSAYANAISEQVQQNIDTLMQTNGCPECNLQGADLNRMELSGADLSGADLSGATFFLTNLSGANLTGANLRDAKFGGADLANADLRNADLRGAVLDGAYLEGSLMDGSMIEKKIEPEEVEADITEKVYVPDQTKPKEVMDQKKVAFEADQQNLAEPEKEQLQQAPPVKNVPPIQQISIEDDSQKKNEEAITEPIETAAAERDLPQESEGSPVMHETAGQEVVESEVLAQENVPPPPKEEPRIAVENTGTAAASTAAEMDTGRGELIEQLFDEKRCYGCDLHEADLSGKNMRKFDLERSDMSGTNLEDADFKQANLKGVSFRGANLRNADLRKADLYKADLREADLTGADLEEALLDEADFTGAIGYQPPLITQ